MSNSDNNYIIREIEQRVFQMGLNKLTYKLKIQIDYDIGFGCECIEISIVNTFPRRYVKIPIKDNHTLDDLADLAEEKMSQWMPEDIKFIRQDFT